MGQRGGGVRGSEGVEWEEGRELECLPSTYLSLRSHKGPLRVASFSIHQTKER